METLTQEKNVAPSSLRNSDFLQFLHVSRPHILSIAFMGTLTFGWLFSGQYFFGLSFVCAFDWFLVNLLNRVVDLPEDEANQIFGTSFASRYRRFILWSGLGSLFFSFPIVYQWFPEIFFYRIAYHTLGLSYNWAILPGKRRIKELYFWKNTASAIGFMITVFCYPLSQIGGSSAFPVGITWYTVAVSALFFFLFELSYEVIYDLRDISGDAQNQVKTYPVVHGEAGAIRIINGLLATSIGVLALGYFGQVVPWRIFIMFTAPMIQFFYYRYAFTQGKITSKDCILLTWLGAILLVLYHLWILLGLPGVQ